MAYSFNINIKNVPLGLNESRVASLLACIFREFKHELMFNATERNQDINMFFAESTMTGHSRAEYIINSGTV